MKQLPSIQPAPPYGPATAEVQHLHDRINAIDLVAEFAAPRGTRAFAADRLDAWQRGLHALYAPDGPVAQVRRSLGPETRAMLEWYEERHPPEPPPSLTLEWAEGPFEILAEPGIPDDEVTLDCYGYFQGGGLRCPASEALDFLRDLLRRSDPELSGLPPPPMWFPFQVWPDTTAVDLRPLARTPLAEFVVTMIHQIIRPAFNDVLAHALLYPRIAHNPHEPALVLIEHGLIPISCDDHACHVFRYNPEPVAVPAWLPYFTLARPLPPGED
jgi:hypothetical protein